VREHEEKEGKKGQSERLSFLVKERGALKRKSGMIDQAGGGATIAAIIVVNMGG